MFSDGHGQLIFSLAQRSRELLRSTMELLTYHSTLAKRLRASVSVCISNILLCYEWPYLQSGTSWLSTPHRSPALQHNTTRERASPAMSARKTGVCRSLLQSKSRQVLLGVSLMESGKWEEIWQLLTVKGRCPCQGKNSHFCKSEWLDKAKNKHFQYITNNFFLPNQQDNYLNAIFDQDKFILFYKLGNNLNLMQNLEMNLKNMIM